MTTWLLEGFGTDRRYSDDVRYRAYTSSKRKAEAFNQIPKIQFTDSGHGVVFCATEVKPGARRLEPRYVLDEYVREHLERIKTEAAEAQRAARKRPTQAQLRGELEAAAEAWFEWDQQALDAILGPYRKEES